MLNNARKYGYPAKENPADSGALVFAIGSVLVAAALGIGVMLIAKKAVAAQGVTGATLALSSADSGASTAAAVGNTISITSPATSDSTQKWVGT